MSVMSVSRAGVVSAVAVAAVLSGAGVSNASVSQSVSQGAVVALAAPSKVSVTMGSYPRVNGLRLRSRGSTSGRIEGLLYRSDRFRIIASQGSWVEVQVTKRSASGLKSGTLGWVYRAYVYKPASCPSSVYVCRHW